MTARGSGDDYGRVSGNATGVARWAHNIPTVRARRDFDHRHAHRSLCLGDFFCAPVLHAADVQQAVVGVLMVHRKQAAFVAVERKVMNAVVMHARLQLLLGGGVASVSLVRGHLARDAHRVAPAIQHLCAITFRHGDRIETGERYRFEAERRST